MTFGYLTAIDICGRKRKCVLWRARCVCGSEIAIPSIDLTRKRGLEKRSCGCKAREQKLIHGMKGHRAWKIFKNIKQRCTNPKNPGYANYGGRGIRVLWNSFAEFWRDMGPTYEPHLEIDRIDNDGHYCRENCRWTTRLVNVNNRRKSIRINGKTLTELAEETGIPRGTLYHYHRHGRDLGYLIEN